jgi:hypothetical protein
VQGRRGGKQQVQPKQKVNVGEPFVPDRPYVHLAPLLSRIPLKSLAHNPIILAGVLDMVLKLE